jgi:TatD DNase family protein
MSARYPIPRRLRTIPNGITLLIDTHCHLYFDAYDEDRDAVIERAAAAGVTRMILPAVDAASGQAGIELAARYPGVYAAVGIHPNDSKDFQPEHLAQIEAQAGQPKVVAIGEIGLDYHWEFSPKADQFRALAAQLALAARLELPVILHNRESSDDLIAVLRDWTPTLPASLRDRPGVLHSFSAPPHIADEALRLGFYLGFTGPITYKNAEELRAIAARVPADRLLIETDGPYLTPQQHRGKRNEPAYVRFVADRLAALRLTSIEEIAAQTTANAERLFRLR